MYYMVYLQDCLTCLLGWVIGNITDDKVNI